MPTKKATSKIPSELNENWGSNYMMDGFWHDMDYGQGPDENPPANPIPQPSTSGMAQLPDGMILALEDDLDVICQEEEGAMDLEGLGIVASFDPDVDRSESGLVDHTWMGDVVQDPGRLPNMPVDNGIPELQNAWGDRTDGIQRINLRDREEFRQDAVQESKDDDPLHLDKVGRLLRSAMRKSAAGSSIVSVKRYLADQVSVREAQAMLRSVKAIEAEHGLVGQVYIRASAYPGVHRGRWAKALRQAAKGCRYLVASEDDDCESCAAVLGLQLVASPNDIDWNEAYNHYASKLSQAGRLDRLATVTDKRETLRRAFLTDGQSPKLYVETAKVPHTMPVDTVSSEEARRVVADFKPPQRVVLDLARRWKKEEAHRVVHKLGGMVKARLLSAEEADRLVRSEATPKAILRAAAKLCLVVKTAKYSGGDLPVVKGEKITREAAWEELRQAEVKAASEAEVHRRNFEHRIDQKVRLIQRAIQGGAQGKRLASLIRKTLTQEEAVAASPKLTPILSKTGALNPRAPDRRVYSDAKFTRHVASKVEAGPSVSEMRKASRWLRQQMSEGFAGPDLDELVRLRINPKVASSQPVVEARAKHEGLAGHLYVDAAAYASKEGTSGCDKGAARHRANGLKLVLGMARCDGCVAKNAEGICQKYNKKVVDEIGHGSGELQQYQRQMISSHQRGDAEDTASMFADNDVKAALAPNLVDEFGLHNAALDDVATEEAPAPTSIDGIFFGGFEV